ncbi:MAG: hypothetical protein ACI84S_000731 [Thalassomonas sp.]|jgi:hypothetical protein
MSKILPAIFIAFLSLFSTNSMGENPADWETYFENDSIKIEFAYQNCEFSSTAKQEVVAFRFTNLINQTISLSYKIEMWNNDQCLNCNKETKEHQKTLTLSSNEIITTNCNSEWKNLVIFSAFITNDNEEKRYESITKFELTAINISHE